MSNADLIRRLREGTEGTDIAKTDPYLNAVMREAADALEDAEAQLKMVLDREAATTARYDAKLDAAEAEVARLREALEEMLGEYGGKYDDECRLKTASELETIARARAALEEAKP